MQDAPPDRHEIDEPDRHWISEIVGDERRGRLIDAAAAVFPADMITVWGQVLSVRQAPDQWHVTLLDGKHHRAWLNATLPREIGPPEVGHMVGIDGHLKVGGSAQRLSLELSGVRFRLKVRGGPWASRFEEWRTQFDKEYARSSPRPLLAPIRKIALVTGPTSKAKADIETALRRGRGSGITVELLTAKLDDPFEIAARIRSAAESAVDAVVIARGGGAPTDLLWFDHPEVVRAVSWTASRRPVITAIGHATDETWIDRLASESVSVPAAVGDLLRFKNNIARRGWLRREPSNTDSAAPRSNSPARRSRWTRFKEGLLSLVGVLLLVSIGWGAHAVYTWVKASFAHPVQPASAPAGEGQAADGRPGIERAKPSRHRKIP